MTTKRIEKKTSRTAAMTCMSRAASALERDPPYHGNDHLAVEMVPRFIKLLLSIPYLRKRMIRLLAPAGIFEYVIARTKYIDTAFETALAEGFDQILLFGAGYDTRALRLSAGARHTRVFELDSPLTQQAKLKQLKRRALAIPANMIFVAIDFDKEPLPRKLKGAGFVGQRRTLFILEGVVMYLAPESVTATFKFLQEQAGPGSRMVFDYVQASVLRHEETLFGESAVMQTVAKAGEQWRFGIEPTEIDQFLSTYGLTVIDHQCARQLEATYFPVSNNRFTGRINETHCLVTALKP